MFRKQYAAERKVTRKVLSEKGMPIQELNKIITNGEKVCRESWLDRKPSGSVYTDEVAHWDFINDVMTKYVQTNMLHMQDYPLCTQAEAEIIRMTCNLYNGDDKTCGVVTSGGTESILLAMLAYREWGLKKGITKPNVVMSESAHAAFVKAGHLFQIEMRTVSVTKDFRMDFKAMKKQIDSNTVALVASSPEFPYGTYDPLPEVAAYAKKLGIGCHNDCCLGSYVNPFVESAGFKAPHHLDFRVPGVTTISVDPHKYGMGPKGVSVLMFANKEWRQHQFFTYGRWNGGLYATTTIAGSRPGNVVVATWAVM